MNRNRKIRAQQFVEYLLLTTAVIVGLVSFYSLHGRFRTAVEQSLLQGVDEVNNPISPNETLNCGNGICEGAETCALCPADCGPCGIVCGNGACEPGETCESCPADCGWCGGPPCGDFLCDNSAGEDCASCPRDCGQCPANCGDTTCEYAKGENCVNCPADCGACPSNCGDLSCTGEENCTNCWLDCGDCCGDGACNYGETCQTCPDDCGVCCGNGVCNDGQGGRIDYGESCFSCSADCGVCCPDGACNYGETCETCEPDCGVCPDNCGNGECQDVGGMIENCQTCPADCGPCCPNGLCQPSFGENCYTCPDDCGGPYPLYPCCDLPGHEACEDGTAGNPDYGDQCDLCVADCYYCCTPYASIGCGPRSSTCNGETVMSPCAWNEVSSVRCCANKPAGSKNEFLCAVDVVCNTAYSWNLGAWGACSVPCGGGTQTRTVECLRDDGLVVADSICETLFGPEPTTQPCNTHCCYAWVQTNDPTCRDSCPNGALPPDCESGFECGIVECTHIYDGGSYAFSNCSCAGAQPVPPPDLPCTNWPACCDWVSGACSANGCVGGEREWTRSCGASLQWCQSDLACPYLCTGGPPPANATWCPNDTTGLTSNLPMVLVDTCTATKCEADCDFDYIVSGSSCVIDCTNVAGADCSACPFGSYSNGEPLCNDQVSYCRPRAGQDSGGPVCATFDDTGTQPGCTAGTCCEIGTAFNFCFFNQT